MALPAGKLRHRVTIEERSRAELSPVGQSKPVWQDREERWARVEALSGREFFAARQANQTVSTRVLLRLPCDLSPKRNRIRFGGRHLNIEEVRLDVIGEVVEVFASEAVMV